MPGADVLQVVASAVSIVDCTVKLAKFMKDLKEDAHDIHHWLLEMEASVKMLQKVLGLVQKVVNCPDMNHADDGLIECICDIVRASEHHAAKILEKLPPVPEDGMISKMKSVLRRLMNDRAIKEHEYSIQKWTGLLQTAVTTLSLQRTSDLARIYEEEVPAPLYPHDHVEFKRVRLKLYGRLSDSLPSTREASLYDVDDKGSFSTVTKAPLSIMDKLKQNELQRYESRVTKLELEMRYLEAATEQGTIVKIRRELKKHTPLSAQEEALLVERQADLLLQCHTIRRRHEATRLLEKLIEDKEQMLSDETNGRIKLRIGELHLAEGKLAHIQKVELAAKFLVYSTNVLGDLTPFPHELYPRSMARLVRAFEILQRTDDVRILKSHVLEQYSNAGLDCDINWEYTDEPECNALAWCRTQINPAFDVESPGFKFDIIIQETSAVHAAVRDGQIEVLREMLVEVEQIDAPDSDGCTPLLIAAQKGCTDIFELLLDHEASPSKVDKSEQTVLHKCQTCSRDGSDIAIARLIHDRAPTLINAQESTGKTALWMACEEGNEKMVEILLSHGADLKISSTKNQTPLQVAIDMRSSQDTQESRISRLHIIKMLLKHGADSNQSDNLGNTPLYTAALTGDLEVVKLLLDPGYKTKLDFLGRHGQTPVAVAVRNRHLLVIRELVSGGASVTLKGVGGKSAEDWAKGDHNKELRDALLEGNSRRMSEHSIGTIHKATSSASSNSADKRDSAKSRPFLKRLRSDGKP
ncbi:ankyrin repeat-containing domain protein [Xylaria cubensis]|nr:ankyrin repeat-containing domain protein [Xylaria cubensis]